MHMQVYISFLPFPLQCPLAIASILSQPLLFFLAPVTGTYNAPSESICTKFHLWLLIKWRAREHGDCLVGRWAEFIVELA